MIDFDIHDYHHCLPPRMSIENVLVISEKESSMSPFALNISGVGSFFPKTKENAMSLIAKHKANRMDVGVMQISSGAAKRRNVSLVELLDPCTNIKHGSGVFLSDFDRRIKQGVGIEQATLDALSAYNTGSFDRGYENGYIARYAAGISGAPIKNRHKSKPVHTLSKTINLSSAVSDVSPFYKHRNVIIRNIKHIKFTQ